MRAGEAARGLSAIENVGWTNFGIATPVATSWCASDVLFKDGFE